MDIALRELLRIHPEPYTFFDDTAVHQGLTAEPAAYLDHLDAGLQSLADGRWQMELPAKQVFRDPGTESDFRVMPCVIRKPRGASKTVKLVGTNTAGGRVPDQITVGRAFALDPEENYVRAGFAACLLSSARTGACAAIALRRLAVPCTRLLVAGCGRVGFYSALYIGGQNRPGEVLLLDREPGRAEGLAAVLGAILPDIRWRAVSRVEEADTMVIATDSRTAVLEPRSHLPATVVSLGADSAWQHELDPDLAGHYRIYVDTLDSLGYGDLHDWLARGIIQVGDVIDLMTLIQQGRTDASPALFVSTGSALFDNLTIDYLLSGSSLAKTR